MHSIILRLHSKFLLVIFFASGFIALVYQMAWQKTLAQLIGVDAYSITLIVSIFMLGLGIGAIVGGIVTRYYKHLLILYIVAEVTLGIFGILSIPVLRSINNFSHTLGNGYVFDFLINFAILLVPTFIMGFTLPVVVHLFRNAYSVGKAVGIVYSSNIAGAAIGTLFAGFILIGTIGVDITSKLMGMFNFVLALLVLLYLRATKKEGYEIEIETTNVATDVQMKKIQGGFTKRLVILSFLSGFVALSYEIIFFRIFTTYFGATSYVFPILITSYLIMMAIGNTVFGKYADLKDRNFLFSIAATLTMIFTLLILWGQELLFALGLRADYLLLWQSRTWLPFAQIPIIFILSLVLMLPVACISGFFPLIVHAATKQRSHLGKTVGYVYFTQTIGNFAGTILSGLVLLPLLGTSLSLRLLGILLLALPIIAVMPFLHTLFHIPKRTLLIPVAIIALFIYPTQFYNTVRRYYGDGTIMQPALVKEGALGATLAYNSLDGKSLEVFVGRMFSNSILVQSPEKIDCFPLDIIATIKEFHPKRGLYIGLGTGAGPLCIKKLFPDIAMDIVEINPELITMMREVGAPEVLEVLDSSHVYLADGRRFIQEHDDKMYDLIQIGGFNAWCGGCGNLFTEEFLQLVAKRLLPNGVLTYNAYPPAIKAGLGVFPNLVLFSPGTHAISHVIAKKDNPPTLSQKQLVSLQELASNSIIKLDEKMLKAGCIISYPDIANLVSNIAKSTDNKPATEYYLTNNQFTYSFKWWSSYKPPRDMRIFECNSKAKLFTSILPAIN